MFRRRINVSVEVNFWNMVDRILYFSCFTDPYYFERNGLYIGQGTAMLSRAGMFRVSEGVGVDMKDRVYELHSFHSKFHLSLTCDIIFLSWAVFIIFVFLSSLHDL